MKLLDTVIGRIVAFITPSPSRIQLSFTLTSLLLVRPGGIGDAVLLAPVIFSLKETFPSVRITILAEKRNAGIFRLIPGVDKLLCYDHPGEFFQALGGRYDVVIDTEQWHRLSAVVARLVSAPIKIGFDTNERRRMFTHTIPYSQDDYESVSFSHLLEPLIARDGVVTLRVPFLSISNTISYQVASLLEQLHDMPFVTIFPGASILERRWGAESFRRAAEKLSILGIKIVVIGGKGDRQQGDVIAGGKLALNLAGMTSLSETAAVIQKSALLLSGDSGLLHVAVSLGVPTVSLFGPGRAKKWAPQGERHTVINKELPCSPCTTFGNTPPCPIHAKCMRDISVTEVVDAVTALLFYDGSGNCDFSKTQAMPV